MDNYKLNPDHYNMIVKAIIEGYHQYIEHRRDRNDNMIISSAFAWTKGNFIESEIAKTCKSFGFSYQTSKAGPTWYYLQFIDDETKRLFLIKNANYFNPLSFASSKTPIFGGKQGNTRTYLQELSEINKQIEFTPKNKPRTDRQEITKQLSYLYISESEVVEQLDLFKSEYESFHVITYQLDNAQQISKIMHYLPNPTDNIAYVVENLSKYISGAELTDADREVIAPEKEGFVDPREFDFGILDDEQENN